MVGSYFQRYVEAGGIMMFLLIPCSLLALGFIIQGFINLRRERIVPRRLLKHMQEMKNAQQLTELMAMVSQERSALGRILNRMLHAEINPVTEERAKEIISEEMGELSERNSQLALIYTVSPLLGLLGTILGMMKSFYEFSVSETHSVAQLSRGINEALVTTMWGLSIAIPAFVFLSLFRHRLFRYEADILPRLVGTAWQRIVNIRTQVDTAMGEEQLRVPSSKSGKENKARNETTQ